jgi:hypothetical protein
MASLAQFGVAVDDRKEIIEVVSQAARQAAHHLHLVFLHEGCRFLSFRTLCFHLFRDVNDSADDLEQRTVGRGNAVSVHQAPLLFINGPVSYHSVDCSLGILALSMRPEKFGVYVREIRISAQIRQR